MRKWAADIESTGLLHMMKLQENPHLHNMGLKCLETGRRVLFSNKLDEIKVANTGITVYGLEQLNGFLKQGHHLYMHNGMTFDQEALIMLGYDGIKDCKITDTLYLSWYLQPKKMQHGLAVYGEQYGVLKPAVEEWENQPQDVYNHRVMEDVEIQYRLCKEQETQLMHMYPKGDHVRVEEFFNMKAKHLLLQQRTQWKLATEKAEMLRTELEDKLAIQVDALALVMPKVAVKQLRTPPAKPFKADGTLSSHGKAWARILIERCLPMDTSEVVIVKEWKVGNPGSPAQVKDWLYSHGWVPETFKFERDKDTGEEIKKPQVNVPNSGGKVDPGVQKLFAKNPDMKHIEGLGILKHRLGMVKGFLENNEDGKLVARAQGFTNTLRLKHRELVNLPSPRVIYGPELRGCLTCEDDEILLGSDLSSLEDKVKQHFQFEFDPVYVAIQQAKGYDPHLQIALAASLLNKEQMEWYKAYKKLPEEEHTPENDVIFKVLDKIRQSGKTTNYACQYGAGAATVARAAGVPLSLGTTLHEGYWKLNWSVKAIAEATKTKKMAGVNWQWNLVSKLWYFLKTDKDRFSTLCQGTGAYICDMWVQAVIDICMERYGKPPALCGQFHDEIILRLRDTPKAREIMEGIVQEAIERVNEKVQMNTTLGCDVSFGRTYADIH